MNFSEAMFYENYLTSDFHTSTVISRRVCLPVKMASKTVIRSIVYKHMLILLLILNLKMTVGRSKRRSF